jgi:molybdopterin-containing oxidoreductase family iron-sulfur binding subunit
VVPDTKVYDGRFANNAWLQEVPDPITRVSWGNAALVSPRTAAELGVGDGRLVRVATARRSVDVPVLVLPGHADGAITLAYGYGRRGSERVASGVGVRASGLLSGRDTEPFPSVSIRALEGTVPLALEQTHASLEGRSIARSRTLAAYRGTPRAPEPPLRTLYHFARSATEQWAMSIDLTACTGCSACVVACQAENNVPVVGRDWVLRGRAMHWLRIDRYLERLDATEGPTVELMPMLCQHCEKAPCEYVCPVGATTHSDEGLNEMTYNRCVGTRFCSNNCPYKVRRFNYLNYNAAVSPSEQLGKNPNVTVRGRGVMEKCTYCVQRIRAAEIRAKNELRRLESNEVITACAQTCPTRAIVFGSLTAKDSEVARLRHGDLAYAALHELGTSPRTTYLERLTNPNPEMGNS